MSSARSRQRLLRDTDAAEPLVLIVPGLKDSGTAHWQTLWHARNPQFERVVQRNWSDPDLEAWADAISERVRLSGRNAILVAHSFGCLASVRAARSLGARVRAALLVAPADPRLFGLSQRMPRAHLGLPSTVVASRNDPWMPLPAARQWARRWGSQFIDLGEAGHINVDSGFGEWPFGARLLRALIKRGALPNVDAPSPVISAGQRSPAASSPGSSAAPDNSPPFTIAI
ncbi:MAG TPA: alpha/beta hydrolase [Usitatibacteraceae bacterium]